MNSAELPRQLGKYRITGVIGEGAMGVVYRGFDPGIARPVALKTVHRQLLLGGDASASAFAARFRNEAQAAGRLSHPGIVSIYEYGEDQGTAFIAMEFVEGRTLAQLLAATPLLPEADVLRLMAQLLDALECAHRAGVCHRDIKPANLVVARDGRLKVMDFGIARIDSGAPTQTTSVVGTPGYIAPEQYCGIEPDHRVDIFAAGVLMYRLLAGRAPFGGTPEAVMYKIFNEDPLPASRVAGGAGTDRYDEVVARALAKDREARFASAAEFLRSIQQAAGPEAPVLEPTLPVAPLAADSTFAPTLPGSLAPTAPATRPPSTGGTLLNATMIGGWDAAALAPIELALARVLGPMARLLVRQAARHCTDVASLTARAAEHIADPGERSAFLSRVVTVRTQPPTTAAPRAAAPRVPPEVVVHALRVVTSQIGPIARIIVKEAAAKAVTADEFFGLLAEEMPAGAQRERMLRKLRTPSRARS